MKGSTRFITLPAILLPNGLVRYINIPKNSVHTVVTDQGLLNGTPLFLATDVLTGTSVTADNQPRIHARYGKQGLATKLTFPSDTRVNGLHGTSRGLWFYTIQGALKVTFELHSADQQVAMMDTLQDVWRKKYKDPPFPASIVVENIKECGNISKDGNSDVPVCGPSLIPEEIDARSEGPSSKKEESVDRPRQSNSGETVKRHYTITVRDTAPKRKRRIEEFASEHVMKVDQCTSTDDRNVDGEVGSLQVHHVEEVLTEGQPPQAYADHGRCWCGSVQRRLQELAGRHGDEILSEELMCSMEHVVEMLHVMTRGEIDTCLQLLNNLSEGITRENPRRDGEEEQRQPPDRVSGVLAEWLGSKFNQEISQISERVVEFKQRNIDQINNLPQAKKLVNTLFPKLMVDFIMTWLGTRTERMTSMGMDTSLNTSSSVLDAYESSARTYDNGPRVSENPRIALSEVADSRYPLAQFILELANQTLISGMAHVIYPRLLQNTNI